MMPKSRTIFYSILTFALVVASLCAFFVLFSMMKSGIAMAVGEENAITTQMEKEDSLSSMQRSIEDNVADASAIGGYVIPSNSVTDFINTLNAIVKTSGVKSELNSINYASSPTLSSINAQNADIDITVEGPWNNVMFFLNLLEEYPLKISIANVSFKQYAQYLVAGKNVPQWSADISFAVVKFNDK